MELNVLPDGYELVGQYTVESVLGSGGFGIAYTARDARLDHLVALKEYFPKSLAERGENYSVRVKSGQLAARAGQPQLQQKPLEVDHLTALINVAAGDERSVYEWGLRRFVHEAQTLAKLPSHSSIPRVFQVFEANGTAYMAYEMVEGQTLRAFVAGLGPSPTQAQVDRLVEPLIEALALLHENGVIHRDIKPDNILVRPDGVPVLLDFGSAIMPASAPRRFEEYSFVSSSYSPPEQYRANRTVRPTADIYALAATLYEMLAGHSVPDGLERVTCDSFRSLRTVVPSSDYRDQFLRAVDWALAVEAAARPQSVVEWSTGLFPWKNLSGRPPTRPRGQRIFISYRRSDSRRQAAELYDRLSGRFSKDDVVFDVDSIPYGVDFRDYVRGSILQSAVVLAVIGPRWQQTLTRSRWLNWWQRRGDFVRVELELALEHGVPIVPVLVGGAQMPEASLLPPSLNRLSYANAATVTLGADAESNLEKLVAAIRRFRD